MNRHSSRHNNGLALKLAANKREHLVVHLNSFFDHEELVQYIKGERKELPRPAMALPPGSLREWAEEINPDYLRFIVTDVGEPADGSYLDPDDFSVRLRMMEIYNKLCGFDRNQVPDTSGWTADVMAENNTLLLENANFLEGQLDGTYGPNSMLDFNCLVITKDIYLANQIAGIDESLCESDPSYNQLSERFWASGVPMTPSVVLLRPSGAKGEFAGAAKGQKPETISNSNSIWRVAPDKFLSSLQKTWEREAEIQKKIEARLAREL